MLQMEERLKKAVLHNHKLMMEEAAKKQEADEDHQREKELLAGSFKKTLSKMEQ